MSRACVDILDINRFIEANNNYDSGLEAFYKSLPQIEEAIQKCRQEIDKFSQNQSETIKLINEARAKKQELEARKAQLEAEIAQLEAMLSACDDAKAAAGIVARIARLEEEVRKVEKKIEKADGIIQKANDMLALIKNCIQELEDSIQTLNKVLKELEGKTFQMHKTSANAARRLDGSRKIIQSYLDTHLDGIPFVSNGDVILRKGINNEYAGKVFDYQYLIDNYNETKDERIMNLYNRVKDYKVKFSQIDKYGNANPLFEKYELLHVTFDELSEENMKKGTCLVGDSSSSSPDFKLLNKKLLEMGYSRIQIAELLSKTNRHHDPDCRTIRLVPKDLHKAIKHFGGASNIRTERAINGI